MGTLFSPTILQHFRSPSNYRDLENAHITQEVENRVCGDRVRLSIRLGERTIEAAGFKGDCCAISKAAASLLTEMLPGLSLAEAAELPEERLLRALQAEITPARMDCALLPLRALRTGVATYRLAHGPADGPAGEPAGGA